MSNGTAVAVWKSLYKRTANELELIPAESAESVSIAGAISSATSLNLTNAATAGLQIFNTSDQVTNYEKFIGRWDSNIFRCGLVASGTGTPRTLHIGAGVTSNGLLDCYLRIRGTASTEGFFEFVSSQRGPVNTPFIHMAGSSGIAASGTQLFFAVNPGIKQSGTAGYTALLVNPVETTTGSGTKLLADFQLGGSSKLSISSSGTINLTDNADISAGSSTGTKIGTAANQKLGFWNASPVTQQVLATGSGRTVDDVISLLQTLGLCRQL